MICRRQGCRTILTKEQRDRHWTFCSRLCHRIQEIRWNLLNHLERKELKGDPIHVELEELEILAEVEDSLTASLEKRRKQAAG